MDYDTKTDRRRLLGISMRVILALVLAGLLVAPIAVQADLKVIAVVDAWDVAQDRWEHSNVIINWDGTWVPFAHELTFDAQILEDPAVCSYDPNVEGSGTEWAGTFYYGLYHVDDAPLNAPGFQESRTWSLVSCDIYDTANPYDRGLVYAECVPSDGDDHWCVVETQDTVVECTTGNCLSEIITTINVNLDLDCDHAIDPGLPTAAGEICFYAQARTPRPDEQAGLPTWSNPLQARIFAESGDKTVNFSLGPTAVELAAFDAAAQDNGVMLTWETATELDNLGFNIYRADSQVGEMNKINASLIPSKDPGSTVGAAYSFLDESAVPGVTYYYWLEDVDVAGAAEMNGPVAARMRAARALPGRGRPAPMPSNAY